MLLYLHPLARSARSTLIALCLTLGLPVLALPVLALAVLALPAVAHAKTGEATAGQVPTVGVTEKVGTTIPLDSVLIDEEGRSRPIGELIDRPTILLFVYYRCPAICQPLMRELAKSLDKVRLAAGNDYRVVLVSFDPAETPAIAKTKQEELFRTLKRRPRDDGWQFLTGPAAAVKALTDATGFAYRYDESSGAYIHASSLIFLTDKGKIVNYVGGLSFLPAQLEMAIRDASEGRSRSFIDVIQRLCYARDPAGRGYVLRLNRIILSVTGMGLLGILGFVFLRRPKNEPRRAKSGDDNSKGAAQ